VLYFAFFTYFAGLKEQIRIKINFYLKRKVYTMENQNENQTVETDTSKVSKDEKTFTQAEVDEIVKKRLGKENAKKQEEIETAKNEAAKLAKMNADQKKDYELEQAKKSAEEANAKLAKYEMRDTARKMLAEKNLNLPDDQLDLVVTDQAEITKAKVDSLAKFAEAIRAEVKDGFLKGTTPRIKGNGTKIITKKDIMKIKDPVKRQAEIAKHLDLFNA